MNNDTAQINLKYLVMPDYVYTDNRLNLTQVKVYCFINSYRGNKFYFTNEQMAEMFNIHPQTVSSAIKSLETSGYIKTEYEIKAGGGQMRFIKNLKDQARLSLIAQSDSASTLSQTKPNRSGKDNKVKDNKVKDIYIQQADEKLNTDFVFNGFTIPKVNKQINEWQDLALSNAQRLGITPTASWFKVHKNNTRGKLEAAYRATVDANANDPEKYFYKVLGGRRASS